MCLFKKLGSGIVSIVIFFWFAVAVSTASSCSSRKDYFSKRTIRYTIMNYPRSIDPRVGGAVRAQTICAKMFEGLLRLDKDGIPQLALAKAIRVSEDKKAYTFTLRPSQWSNGSRVTAYDFEYAWKSVLSHRVQTMHAAAFFCIKNAKKAFDACCSIDDVGIRALDDSTLHVELEFPASYFLEWVANPLYSPICSSCLKGKSALDMLNDADFVCNGPYKLSKRILSQQIDLERNPYYWNQEAVHNEKLQFFVMEDATTAYNLFLQGELDCIGNPLSTIPLSIEESLASQNALNSRTRCFDIWLSCNLNCKALSSAKIRRAIACSIDRQEISSKLFHGRYSPIYSIVSRKNSLLDFPAFKDADPIAARKLFEEGLAEIGYTRETFPALTLFSRPESEHIALWEIVCQQLRSSLGISICMQPVDVVRLSADILQGRFELADVMWTSYLNDPIYNLEAFDMLGGGFLPHGWKNQDYNNLIRASNNECDLQQRRGLLRAAEALVTEEMPSIPIVEMPFFYAKQEYVREDF